MALMSLLEEIVEGVNVQLMYTSLYTGRPPLGGDPFPARSLSIHPVDLLPGWDLLWLRRTASRGSGKSIVGA